MKKIMLVFGTRPEAIKMCPLVKELKDSEKLQTIVCVTGQHREMLKQVLDIFNVEPDYDLAVMQAGQDLFDITQKVMQGMKEIMLKAKPDIVLVHGDTSTAYATALAAFYLQIPIGHVEAGLRTYRMDSPFPEEFNRQAIGLIAKYHFAPTELSKENLLKEGKSEDNVFVTGNTGIDALFTTVKKEYSHPDIDWAKDSKLLVITAHRRENLGEPMHAMFKAIRKIVEEFDDVKAVYPIHMNPVVRQIAQEELEGCDRIRLIEPMAVNDFHNLLNKGYFIITDSGGIQEEAPALGKPVLVMRDTTERPEGVKAGTLKLTGTSELGIYTACKELIEDVTVYERMSKAQNPYGDGKASGRIRKVLENLL